MTTVLVTGGAGFIGHHLVAHLLEHTDHNVVSLDRLDISGDLSRLGDILEEHPEWRKRLRIVWHDLKAEVNDLVSATIGPVEYILHLAAGSHVDRSIVDPLSFVMDNVVGTCNILNYARLKCPGLRLFLAFGTDEIYGPAPEGVFFKEEDGCRPGNPYAGSKLGAEALALAFQNTYQMPIVATHSMNLIGVRQHPEKYLPLVTKKVMLGERVYVHSNPERTQAGKRHYLANSDLCDAILLLMEKAIPGERYNIVGERELDNLEMAAMVAVVVGKPLDYEMTDFHSQRPGHDLRYALDGSKMACMGWRPKKSIEERVREIVEWSIEHPKWLGM